MILFILRRGLEKKDHLYFTGSNKWEEDIQKATVHLKKGTAKSVRSLKETKETGPVWVIKMKAEEVEAL